MSNNSSYAVIFPNHPEPELNLLPWRFQEMVASHQAWHHGLRMKYFTGTENWVAWITDDTLDYWRAEFDSIGAILAKQKKKIEPSEDEKYYNKTGIRRSGVSPRTGIR